MFQITMKLVDVMKHTDTIMHGVTKYRSMICCPKRTSSIFLSFKQGQQDLPPELTVCGLKSGQNDPRKKQSK